MLPLTPTSNAQSCDSSIVFEPMHVITGNGPAGLTVADVDLDGRLDILTANFDGANASLLYQNPAGGFDAPIPVLVGLTRCNDILVDDLDGDPFPDIVAITAGSSGTGQISLRFQTGPDQFTNQIGFFGIDDAFRGFSIADFDMDGAKDAAVISEFAQDDDMLMFWNNGAGLFFERTSVSAAGNIEGTSLATADFNLDGLPDIVATDRGGDDVLVFENLGSRQFASSSFDAVASGTGLSTNPTRVEVADLNGDAFPDIVVSLKNANSATGAIVGFINDGGPTVSFSVVPGNAPLAVGVGADSFAFGDLTLDGISDLAIIDLNGGTPDRVLVLAGEGDGTFCEFAELDLGIAINPERCLIADIDADGDNDLLVTADSNDPDQPAGTDLVVIFESNPGAQDCNNNSIPDSDETFPELNWDTDAGGLFSASSSWCPRRPPAPGDDVAFDLDGVFDATLNTGFLVEQVEFRRGSPRLIAPGGPGMPPTLTIGDARSSAAGGRDGDLEVGVLPGVPATLEIAGGTVLVGPAPSVDTIHIATVQDTIGDVRVTGPDTLLRANASRIDIGTFGHGSLLIDGGGRVEGGEMLLGLIATETNAGTGTLSVRGEGSVADIETSVVIRQGRVEVLDGGAVNALVINVQGGELVGNGTLNANISNRGVVAPGADDLRGTLNVVGGYNQQGTAQGVVQTGQLRMDLAGEQDSDKLIISGTAQLAGGLKVVAAGDLSDLADDVSIPIVEAGSIASRFDVAFLPGLSAGRFLRVVYNESGTVSLVVGTLEGDLGFGSENSVGFGGVPRAATLADMNLDGLPDVVLAVPDDVNPSGAPGSIIVLFNGGLGGPGGDEWLGFTSSIQVPAGVDPAAVAVADLDLDGGPDIVVANRGEDNVLVLVNNGSGEIDSITPFASVGFNDTPTAVAIGDLNEDGRNDVAVAGLDPNNSVVGELTVRLNSGGTGGGWAGLGANAFRFTVGSGAGSMEIGDFDNDTCLDIFLTTDGDEGVNLLDNLGNEFGLWQGFLLPRTVIRTGQNPVAATTKDLDGDGFLDLIVADGSDSTLSIILQEGIIGELEFRPPTAFAIGTDPRSVVSADLDGDGDSDLALVVNDESETARVVQLYRNDLDVGSAQLQFSPASTIVSQSGEPLFVLAGDVDGLNGDDVIAIGLAVSPPPGSRGGGISGQVTTTLNIGQSLGCNVADIAEPFDVLDLADISVFVTGFTSGDPVVDFDQNGIYDLADITVFVTGFAAGCH